MITPPECRREIDELMATLTEAGLLLRSNPTTQIVAHGLTWVTWARGIPKLPVGGVSVTEYRRILQDAEYNALLKDGGVLQLSFAFERDVLVKHRLSWIPAPVQFDDQATEEVDVADLVDEALIAAGLQIVDDDDQAEEDGQGAEEEGVEIPGKTDLLLVAPVRFDFDSRAAAEDHAASHLTFNRASCRIPVYGPVSLGHFVRFTFKHFYADEWKRNDRMRQWALRFGERLVTAAQQEEIFIDCRQSLPPPPPRRLGARKRQRAPKRAV